MSKVSEFIDRQIAEAHQTCAFSACRLPSSDRFGGLPICDDHGNAVVDLAGARRPKPKNDGTNRHGIPLRGGDPKRCIWPRCVRAHGIHPGARMCSEHAEMIAEIVNRHRRAIVAIQNERVRKRLEDPDVQKLRQAVDGRPRVKPKRDVIGPVVYYIKYAELVKIGSARDLEARLASYNPGGELLAVEPGDRDLERKRHSELAVHRIYGNEWYAATPPVLHHVKLVRSKHGEPPDVQVGPAPVTIPQPRDPQYVAGKRFIKPGGVLYGKYR